MIAHVRHRGFALLLTVMGALAVIILAAEFHFASWLEGVAVRYHINDLRASALARSGVELAMYIINEDEWEYDHFEDLWAELNQQAAGGIPLGNGVLSLKIVDESGKININTADPSEVRNIFSLLDVSRKKKGEITGIVMEDRNYQADLLKLLAKRPITHLSVLASVASHDGYQSGAGLPSCLTVWGDGKVNVNTASEPALYALKPVRESGVADRLVASLITNRPYEHESAVTAVIKQELGDIPGPLKEVMTFKSRYFRIFSTGVVSTVRSKVETVVHRTDDGALQIVSWCE